MIDLSFIPAVRDYSGHTLGCSLARRAVPHSAGLVTEVESVGEGQEDGPQAKLGGVGEGWRICPGNQARVRNQQGMNLNSCTLPSPELCVFN